MNNSTQGNLDKPGGGSSGGMTDGPAAIIGDIFDSAGMRAELAPLIGPLHALWDADQWKSESIVAAVEAIDFGKAESSRQEGDS
jgi:hypothetical protein